jgi:hypothetical protein
MCEPFLLLAVSFFLLDWSVFAPVLTPVAYAAEHGLKDEEQ